MILDCAGVPTHLSYCTNIHAGDAWDDVFPELRRQLPLVRSTLARSGPMGLGLRLSNNSLESLRQPEKLEVFRQWLAEQDHYVFTLNGFPYGAFHGQRVKEDVYKPDWTEESRLIYTCQLATLLCELNPPEHYGSISTLPGTYKDWMMPGTEERISHNLVQAVAHCVKLAETTGVTIALALEPEPCCMLETVAETVLFFRNHLFCNRALDELMSLTGLDRNAADAAMHRHIGVCYDVCHSAVEFENPAHAIARLQSAGIDIVKIQLSSALEILQVNEASLRHLARFDEPVYLHQVVERRGNQLTRYTDLRTAIAASRHRMDARSTLDPALQMAINSSLPPAATTSLKPISEADTQWRVHFHVPVFVDRTEHFSTTQSSLSHVLQLQKLSGFCRHLEVETYTWDVLPEDYRQQPVSQAIARELNWVGARLAE